MDSRLLDKEWRINHLYQIKTKNGQIGQFKRNPAQADYSKKKSKRNIILKSRQIGFTTQESIEGLDFTMFNRNFKSLFIAHDKQASLDIFDDKILFAWNNLPKEIKALYSVDSENVNTLGLGFGDGSESKIFVRTSGRSGTYQKLHISELAKICLRRPDMAKEILEGTIPSLPIDGEVTIESTAEGSQGLFHDMFWDNWGREPKYPVEYKAHFYNWTWDKEEIQKAIIIHSLPSEFLALQKEHNLSDLEISYYYMKFLSLNKDWDALRQEYPTTPKEAFETSVSGAYYNNQLQVCINEKRVCGVPYNPYLEVETSWDLGGVRNKSNDTMVVGVWQRHGKEIRLIDCIYNSGEPYDWYFRELETRGYKHYKRHILPWDARIGSMSTGETVEDLFYEKAKLFPSLSLNKVDIAPNTTVYLGIEKVRSLFNRFWINEVKCDQIIKALRMYRKGWDDKMGVWKNEALHDENSHFADMVRYYCLAYEDERIVKPTQGKYTVKRTVDPITGY